MPFTFNHPYEKQQQGWHENRIKAINLAHSTLLEHNLKFKNLEISTFKFENESLDTSGVIEIINHLYIGNFLFKENANALENHIVRLIQYFGACQCYFFLSIRRLSIFYEATGWVAWQDKKFKLPNEFAKTEMEIEQLFEKALRKLFAITAECRNKRYLFHISSQKAKELDKLAFEWK